MITEYLFYSPKLLACAQVNINMLHKSNSNGRSRIRFSNWTYGLEIQTQSEALLPGKFRGTT
jgi:hypothetical protein